MTELAVWWSERVVGHLRPSGDGALFRYAADATEHDRISASLPVDPSRDQPGTFFSNLLPDGELRERLARRLGVSPANDFAMLEAVGGDCAGALSLLPAGTRPAATSGRRALTPKLLRQVQELGSVALVASEGVRLSLAGAQDKLPVIEEAGKLYLPQGQSASTHVLKLPSVHFRGLAENELLMLLLAKEAGLPIVSARIWPLPGETGNGLLVTRFDRAQGTRLHQEDTCQALGVPPSRKYEADGGPAFADVIQLISSHSTQPAADIEKVIRWQVFNALTGNADGHAKNLAYIRHEGRVALAPFYDLVCTRHWGSLSTRLAFSVGGVSDPGQIGKAQWTRAARVWEVAPSFLLQIVRETIAALKKALPELPTLAAEAGVDPAMVSSVAEIVRKLLRRAASQIGG